jgi:hypothetical protein
VNQHDVAKLFAYAYLRVATPQNAISGLQSWGMRPYNPIIFSDTDYAPASVTDSPYPDCARASPTHPPESELPQLCAEEVSLSKTSTLLTTDSMTQSDQLKSGPYTSYSPRDVRPCPTARKSVNIGLKKKCQQAEILTSTPVKKQQRDKSDKKRKKSAKVCHEPCSELSEVRSERKMLSAYKTRYFCQVYGDPYTEPPKNWHSADSVPCGVTSCIQVTVDVDPIIVMNALTKLFLLICIDFTQLRSSLYPVPRAKWLKCRLWYLLNYMHFFSGEVPRSRRYGSTAAMRLIV